MNKAKKKPAPKQPEIPEKPPAVRTRARGTPTGQTTGQTTAEHPVEKPAKNKAAKEKQPTAKQEYSTEDYLAALHDAYPPSVMIAHIDSLLKMEKSYKTRDGTIVTHPDPMSRAKGVDLVLQRVIGKPIEQAEVKKTSKAKDFGELMERAKKSEPFRQSMIELLNKLIG